MKKLDLGKFAISPSIRDIRTLPAIGSGESHDIYKCTVSNLQGKNKHEMHGVLRIPRHTQDDIERRSIEEQFFVRDGLVELGIPTIPTYRLLEYEQKDWCEPQHYILATDLSEEEAVDVYSPTNVAKYQSWPGRPVVKEKFSGKRQRVRNAVGVIQDTWNIALSCANGGYLFNSFPDNFFYCIQKDEPRSAKVLIGDYKHLFKVRSADRNWILECNLKRTRWALDALSPLLGLEGGEASHYLRKMALKEGVEVEEYENEK